MIRLISMCTVLTLLSACAAPPSITDFTASSGSARVAEQLAVRFEKADLSLRVEPDTKRISGEAVLTFAVTAPLTRVALELDRNLAVSFASIDGVALAPAAISNADGRLFLTLPAPLAAGARTTVRVRYAGAPHVAKRAPWDGGFVWKTTPDGRPWIATAVQGEGCDLFWPCIDHPQGKPGSVDLHISVPAPLVAASNGIAMGMDERDGWRTYHWRARQSSTYGISLNIGPYSMMTGSYKSRFGNTIPLAFWHLPHNAAAATELFAEFAPMLDFFESRVGPYPFGDEKMGVVETPHLGMEHQTINAYGNGYTKAATGYDWLLHHELAHEWFGNQMTNANWDDMWLHEGFGSYMQPLYLQQLRGEQAFQAALFEQRKGISNKNPMVTGKDKRIDDVYQEERGGAGGDIYTKGSLILHTLRGLIGDDAFFRSVRRLVYGTATPVPGAFKPRYATTKEFMTIVREESGRDLDWFFNAYLYQAALPELVAQRDGDRLMLSWILKNGGVFPMPVQVRVGDRTETVAMTGGLGELKVPAGTSYQLDPLALVLRHEAHIEAWRKQLEQRRKKAPPK